MDAGWRGWREGWRETGGGVVGWRGWVGERDRKTNRITHQRWKCTEHRWRGRERDIRNKKRRGEKRMQRGRKEEEKDRHSPISAGEHNPCSVIPSWGKAQRDPGAPSTEYQWGDYYQLSHTHSHTHTNRHCGRKGTNTHSQFQGS